MNIIINNDDFYNRNIYIPQEADYDLLSYDIFNIPEMTFQYDTNENKWVNGFFMVADKEKSGIFLKKDNQHFRIMLGAEFEPFLYRGENNIYDYFQPYLQRINNEIDYCIEMVKQIQFKQDFLKTPFYSRLSKMNIYNCKMDFDLEALAQHYEFRTNYLDLTKCQDVAEFFAYTYIDKETGLYKPIDNFNDLYPVLYKA